MKCCLHELVKYCLFEGVTHLSNYGIQRKRAITAQHLYEDTYHQSGYEIAHAFHNARSKAVGAPDPEEEGYLKCVLKQYEMDQVQYDARPVEPKTMI